jgi:hypothetical protein
LLALDISQGYEYFLGNFSNRGRYEKLTEDLFDTFVNMNISKARNVLPDVANCLLKNRDRFKQYLVKQKWLASDMTNHKWVNIHGSHLLGNITDNALKNSNGV